MIGFQLIFFVFVAFIIFINISKYIKNENSPIISTKAKLIKKKRETCTNTDSNGVMTTTEKLILEFELDTGSEIKFTVGRRVFKNVPEHEWGTLIFQGTRFLKFNSSSGVVEK
ncbi:DUF2500 domain-containing protein [Clostridium beijerinckii]|uniref:DUF2500 domain-containing protein n=1 Tax=Clostridium beijerinckii TaxID=1520 RepID=A0A1S8RTS4_CLOBE|nr:DUF2500 domain-containing protein [Clostridium beijerinckii]NRY63655.1 hypothetical protein [Clostridium beijerinckii]OOM56568.1 hypothetical protein CLBCK_43250 [Clostridium beijerinckii]